MPEPPQNSNTRANRDRAPPGAQPRHRESGPSNLLKEAGGQPREAKQRERRCKSRRDKKRQSEQNSQNQQRHDRKRYGVPARLYSPMRHARYHGLEPSSAVGERS